MSSIVLVEVWLQLAQFFKQVLDVRHPLNKNQDRQVLVNGLNVVSLLYREYPYRAEKIYQIVVLDFVFNNVTTRLLSKVGFTTGSELIIWCSESEHVSNS